MNLKRLSILYNIYALITSYFTYRRELSIVKPILYTDKFKELLYKYLKTEFHTDWIGRIYGVINPIIADGKIDISSAIIELDDQRTNNEEQVKYFLYKQLSIIAQLFSMENLYTYLTCDIDHVGPMDHDNFLVVFDIASRQEYTKNLKYLFLHFLLYGLIFGAIWTIYL